MTGALQTAPSAVLQSAAALKLYTDIHSCQSPDQLDAVGSLLWGANATGHVSDGEAAFLDGCIRARRPPSQRAATGRFTVPGRLSRFVPRRPQRSPDRRASRDRRRMLGGSSALPDNLRCHFTEGQRAVLCVVAGAVKQFGMCEEPIDKIAALAGVCRTTVQNALHEARRLGLLRITERPQPGRKSKTNLVEVISREWLTWIRRGPSAASGIGSKSLKIVPPTKSKLEGRKRLGGELSPQNGHGPPSRGAA